MLPSATFRGLLALVQVEVAELLVRSKRMVVDGRPDGRAGAGAKRRAAVDLELPD